MADTQKLHFDADYYPLLEGYRLRYEFTSTDFEGVEHVEIVITSVHSFQKDAKAEARIVRTRMGKPSSGIFKIRRTTEELYAEGGVLGLSRREFPRPPVPGRRWNEPPDLHEVAALDATVQVPAGRFNRCLRVNTYLAGGDSGSAIRYYAPGVGYVYEEYADETRGARAKLVAFELPPSHEKR